MMETNIPILEQIESLKKLIDNIPISTEYVDKLRSLTQLLWQVGDLDRCLLYNRKALEYAKQLNYKMGIAHCYNFIATATQNREDSIHYYYEAYRIYEEMDYQTGIATVCNNLGILYKNVGAYEEAFDYFKQALVIKRKLNQVKSEMSTLGNIGNLFKEQGKVEQALLYYEQVLAFPLNVDNAKIQADICLNVGNLYNTAQKYQDSTNYYEKAASIYDEYGFIESFYEAKALSLKMLATLSSLSINDPYLLKIESHLEEIHNYHFRSNILTYLAEIHYLLQNYVKSCHYYRQVLFIKDAQLKDKLSQELEKYHSQFDLEKRETQLEKHLDLINRMLASSADLVNLNYEITQPLSVLKWNIETLLLLDITHNSINPIEIERSVFVMNEQIERIQKALQSQKALFVNPESSVAVIYSLNDCLNQVLDTYKSQFSLYSIEVFTRLDEDLPNLKGFPNNIIRILFSIIQNTIEALTSCDKNNLFIRITTRMKENDYLIEIEDNGPGIAPNYLTHIFEPFFTTKEDSNRIGLGLAIAKVLAIAHRGEITAENRIDGGAFFRIRLCSIS